jgi:hypothetical protein
MNPFAQLFFDTLATICFLLIGIIRRILLRAPRYIHNVRTAAVVATGLAGMYFVLAGLFVAGGIAKDQPVLLTVGLILMAILAILTKAFVQLCERIAPIVMRLFGGVLNPVGLHLTQIDLGVQELLTDIGMCFIMCSVFALDGQKIGLTLPMIGWCSLASLVAIVILSGQKISNRRKLMVGATALFVIFLVLFHLSPATKQLASATFGRTQYEQFNSAEGIAPTTPPEALAVHQTTEKAVVANELIRYQKEVTNFLAISARRTPTDIEIANYRNALNQVTQLNIKLRYSQPAEESWHGWHSNMWLGAVWGLIVIIVAILIILWIAKAIKSNTSANTTKTLVSATTASPVPPAAGHGFSWKTGLVSAAVVIALVFLGMMAFRSGGFGTQAQASVLPPTILVPPTPAPAAQQSGQTSIVVYDPKYDETSRTNFGSLPSDTATGEYRYWIAANVLKQDLPVVPNAGETWEFSFSDTSVCAFNVPCVGPAGQGGKPSGLHGDDRAKYNADDFPAQNARYQEAAAYTGDGVLELGNPDPWMVTDAAAGKTVAVGFNIRRSEIASAHGGGTLTIRVRK